MRLSKGRANNRGGGAAHCCVPRIVGVSIGAVQPPLLLQFGVFNKVAGTPDKSLGLISTAVKIIIFFIPIYYRLKQTGGEYIPN